MPIMCFMFVVLDFILEEKIGDIFPSFLLLEHKLRSSLPPTFRLLFVLLSLNQLLKVQQVTGLISFSNSFFFLLCGHFNCFFHAYFTAAATIYSLCFVRVCVCVSEAGGSMVVTKATESSFPCFLQQETGRLHQLWMTPQKQRCNMFPFSLVLFSFLLSLSY